MYINYSRCFFTDLIFTPSFLHLFHSFLVPLLSLFYCTFPGFSFFLLLLLYYCLLYTSSTFFSSCLTSSPLFLCRASRCPNRAATRLSLLTIFWR